MKKFGYFLIGQWANLWAEWTSSSLKKCSGYFGWIINSSVEPAKMWWMLSTSPNFYLHCCCFFQWPLSFQVSLFVTLNSSLITPPVCLLPDLSVPFSDIPCSGGPGLLPHLWQVLPGLQCGAGICRLDLIRSRRHTQDSRQPQQTPQPPQTGQGVHCNPSFSTFKDSLHLNKLMKLDCLVTLHSWYFSPLCLQIPSHTLARLCMCVTAAITVFLLIQRSPVTYYIYCLLPVPVWYSVLKEWVTHTFEKKKGQEGYENQIHLNVEAFNWM